MTAVKADILKELEAIRKKRRGILKAEDVVEAATDPDSPLHDQFTWDDTKAAKEYRLWQARELIRVVVQVLPNTEKSTRVFVSLMDDRQSDGGGYRTMIDVLRTPIHRAKLLEQAKAEADAYRQKYQLLEELAEIFAAMDRTFKKK